MLLRKTLTLWQVRREDKNRWSLLERLAKCLGQVGENIQVDDANNDISKDRDGIQEEIKKTERDIYQKQPKKKFLKNEIKSRNGKSVSRINR